MADSFLSLAQTYFFHLSLRANRLISVVHLNKLNIGRGTKDRPLQRIFTSNWDNIRLDKLVICDELFTSGRWTEKCDPVIGRGVWGLKNSLYPHHGMCCAYCVPYPLYNEETAENLFQRPLSPNSQCQLMRSWSQIPVALVVGQKRRHDFL